MSKILAIALTEYRLYVVTKTFIISILLMPLLFGLMLFIQVIGQSAQPIEDRRFAVYDATGRIYPGLLERARQHNRHEIFESLPGSGRKQVEPRFLPEKVELSELSVEEQTWILSERVREEDVFAFIIIGNEVLNTDLEDAPETEESAGKMIAYHSNHPAHQTLPDWLNRAINQEIRKLRFADAGLNQDQVETLQARVDLSRLGLIEKDDSGETQDAEEDNPLLVIGVPFGVLMILFVCANTSAPLMLNSVIEEKMNKIAEVLLGAVSPLQLLLGKMLGTVLVGLTLSSIYLISGAGMLFFAGHGEEVAPAVYFWFAVFLLLTLVSFGAIWASIGAACSHIKDTQNFSSAIAVFIMMPVMLAPLVLAAPDGTFTRVISLVPPFTPFLMMMRITIPPGVSLWEILLGVATTSCFALVTITLGARIFEKGFLWQGEAASFKRIWQWLRE